jgi:hypothetical protein
VLFAEMNRQIDAMGFVLKAGTLSDKTLVKAAVARPPHSEGDVATSRPRDRLSFLETLPLAEPAKIHCGLASVRLSVTFACNEKRHGTSGFAAPN